MSFFRDRAIGHGTALEALHDGFNRLDFIDRNRFGLVDFEIHQATKGEHFFRLIINRLGIFFENRVVAEAGGHLELMDGDRVKEVTFPAGTPLVDAAWVECGTAFVFACAVGLFVAGFGFLGNGAEADAFHAGSGLGEVSVDDRLAQADRFKDLRTTVGSHRGDAHL